MQETAYTPLLLLGLGALFVIYLAGGGARFIHRRFFKFRPLNATEVVSKLRYHDLGTRIISDKCLADLPGKSITDLELELKRFIALVVMNKPVEYVLSHSMKSVWQCVVRDHDVYTKLQKSLLGGDHTFTVLHAEPGGPIDLSTAYNAFYKAYVDVFGTPDPKIWPRIYRHGKGLEDEVLLISIGRNQSGKGPGAPNSHDVHKTVGLGHADPMAG